MNMRDEARGPKDDEEEKTKIYPGWILKMQRKWTVRASRVIWRILSHMPQIPVEKRILTAKNGPDFWRRG